MFSEQNNNTVYSGSSKYSAIIKIKWCHPQAQLSEKSNLILHITCVDQRYELFSDKVSGVVLRNRPIIDYSSADFQAAVVALARGLLRRSRRAAVSRGNQVKLAKLPIRLLKHAGGLINILVPALTGWPPILLSKREQSWPLLYSTTRRCIATFVLSEARAEADVCDTAWMKTSNRNMEKEAEVEILLHHKLWRLLYERPWVFHTDSACACCIRVLQ